MNINEAILPDYLGLCERMTIAPQRLKALRSQVAWYRTVGAPNGAHPVVCVPKINKVPEIKANLPLFAKFDEVCPPMFKVGNYSSEVYRFAETVTELYNNFGDLSNKTIVEFGANIGAEAYCLLTQWPNITNYYLVDLPQVQALSKVYLQSAGMTSNAIKYDNVPQAPDLFISNYTLSEFTADDLYAYYTQYGEQAKSLFMRINFAKKVDEDAFIIKVKENFDILKLEDEIPGSSPNKLLIAKRKP